MPEETFPPAAPQQPDRPTVLPTRRDPTAYLWGLMGLGLIAYGVYQCYLVRGMHSLGSFLALCGVTMLPWSIVSMLGGVALLVWAGWWTLTRATYPMDYLFTVLAIVFGLTAIVERIRGIRANK